MDLSVHNKKKKTIYIAIAFIFIFFFYFKQIYFKKNENKSHELWVLNFFIAFFRFPFTRPWTTAGWHLVFSCRSFVLAVAKAHGNINCGYIFNIQIEFHLINLSWEIFIYDSLQTEQSATTTNARGRHYINSTAV